MAAASGEKFPDIFQLQSRLRANLERVLNAFEGRKDLVLDPDLMRPLDRIAGAKFLKANGVDKIFILDRLDRQKSLVGCNQRIYLVKPKMRLMKILADQITNEKARGEVRNYRIVMVPRELYLCTMVLEQEGVYGDVTVDEFPLDLIPLDTDILSMGQPEFFRDFYMDGDQTWLQTVCRSVQTLQGLMGEIPNIYCIGRASQMCYDLLKHLMGGDKLIQPDYPKSEIGHLFFIDREVDYVTALCTQVSYEALLDDIFGIDCGYVNFGSDVTQKEAATKVLLTSEDPMFEEIRNRHFTNVFDYLKTQAQNLQTVSDKRKNLQNVSEMKEFVAKDLRTLNQTKANLSCHIGACEVIISKKTKGDFEEYLQTEHSLLEGTALKDNMNYIEDSINKQNNLVNNLKLLCLMSLTNDGIPTRDYRSLKTQFIQSHGFEQMITFSNLDKIGLLREQDTRSQSKMAAGVASLTKSSSFKMLRKKLNLVPSEDVDLRSPCDMSYVFSGAYAPLSCKLIEQSLHREGFQGMEEIVRNIPGGAAAHLKLKTPAKGMNTPGRAAKVVLVYFLGGCSYSEIAALRFLGKQTGYRFIVATTSIFTGSTLLESVMEKPQI